MVPKASTCIVVFIMVLYSTTISAFNITRLLDNHPEYSTFNDMLTKTGLANDINKRQTITVLVVENSGMGSITSRPQATIKNIMATHALLDYYDINKITDLSKSGSIAVNFFQNSGIAYKEQGQTRVTTTTNGEVVFASAMKGAPLDSKMVKSVAAQPYNISVIQITQPIVTPGLDQTAPANGPSGGPKAALPPALVVKPPPEASEAPDSESPADGPADDDAAADAPEGEGPAASSGPAPGPAPDSEVADKEPVAKAAPPPKNGGAQLTASGAVLVSTIMGLVALSL